MLKYSFSRLRQTETFLLLLIFLLALALRIWGIGWGLPFLYHPDEHQLVERYLWMVKTGDLNPRWFIYPSFPLYINAAGYGLYFLLKLALGRFHSLEEVAFPHVLIMGAGIIGDPKIFWIGRMISILFGLGTVYLSYRCAKLVSGKALPGLLAALFTAVSNANVTQSRLILPNIFVAFFALLTIWFSLRMHKHGRTGDYILAGIAAGLTAASKYNGGVVALVPVAAHFLRAGWRGWKDVRIYLVAGTAALAFLLTTPYAVLDFPAFSRDLIQAKNDYAGGWPGFSAVPFTWYLSYLWRHESLPALAALGGLLWAAWKRQKDALIAGLFPLGYFLFISAFRYYNEHTLLHLLPALHVMAALFFGWLLKMGQDRFPSRKLLVNASLGLLIAAAGLILLITTIEIQASVLQVNSRETSRVWIEENIPPGATIAIESYSPYVDPQKYHLVIVPPFLPKELAWYQENGVQFLVFSEGMYGRYFADPAHHQAEIGLYEQLFTALDPVKIFNEGDYEIRIYRMPSP